MNDCSLGLTQNIMTDSYKLSSARAFRTLNKFALTVLAATILAAAPVLAQTDVRDAPFWGTMAVADTGGKLGAVNGTDDGVTIMGGQVLVGGNLILKLELSGAGDVRVLADLDNDLASFEGSVTQNYGAGGTKYLVWTSPGFTAAGGNIWVRVVFTSAGGFIPATDVDHSATYTGEIEDN